MGWKEWEERVKKYKEKVKTMSIHMSIRTLKFSLTLNLVPKDLSDFIATGTMGKIKFLVLPGVEPGKGVWQARDNRFLRVHARQRGGRWREWSVS